MSGRYNYGLILSILFHYVTTNNMCIKPSDDEIGKKLPVSQFTVLFEIGLYMCLKECETYAMCLSINFNRKMLMCELNSQKKNESLLLVDDDDFIYRDLPGIFDYRDKKCGNVSCEQHSKCVQMKFNNSLCIAIGCAEPVPDLNNGRIANQSFSPPSVTFECNPHHKGVGTNTITCPPGGKWSSLSYRCEPAVDCLELFQNGQTRSGVYTIYPGGIHSNVLCNMDISGGGWTVIQNRFNGSLDFNRNWTDYKNGFGSPIGEYWIGNEIIYELTKNHTSFLHVTIMLTNGTSLFQQYETFSIGNEQDNYRLYLVGNSSGTLGDRMINVPSGDKLNGMKFSTKDRDNDRHHGSCADSHFGGWWYNSCHDAYLNGLYGSSSWMQPWYPKIGGGILIKETVMMVKRS
ncbi:angiopoietin-1-like [Ostrea edulis]|uniref:angiopoietin-1-like n=1 Tax=Ostrea edulis TaxID=37623 RepID=UPI0024AEF186|nr:angiopoietin-1-like [Ostrea edulis]